MKEGALCRTTTKSLLTENKDFWKYLRRNFVVSFHYLSDFLFGFFVEEIYFSSNEEIITHIICNIEFQPIICDF